MWSEHNLVKLFQQSRIRLGLPLSFHDKASGKAALDRSNRQKGDDGKINRLWTFEMASFPGRRTHSQSPQPPLPFTVETKITFGAFFRQHNTRKSYYQIALLLSAQIMLINWFGLLFFCSDSKQTVRLSEKLYIWPNIVVCLITEMFWWNHQNYLHFEVRFKDILMHAQ